MENVWQIDIHGYRLNPYHWFQQSSGIQDTSILSNTYILLTLYISLIVISFSANEKRVAMAKNSWWIFTTNVTYRQARASTTNHGKHSDVFVVFLSKTMHPETVKVYLAAVCHIQAQLKWTFPMMLDCSETLKMICVAIRFCHISDTAHKGEKWWYSHNECFKLIKETWICNLQKCPCCEACIFLFQFKSGLKSMYWHLITTTRQLTLQ